MATARAFEFEGWEKSEFPIVCETCLGDNPAIRMVRATCDRECRICNRACTGFRWQPGRKARYKTTIICQLCAKMKNVCQVCLFDLQYGLPVQVRDKILQTGGSALDVPVSRVNRDYMVNKLEKTAQEIQAGVDRDKVTHPVLAKIARTQPYYKRNTARVCTFWLRGACTRGDTCPFRHEDDKHEPQMSNQKIKDRFYGVNDPVANKILTRLHDSQTQDQEGKQEQPPPPSNDTNAAGNLPLPPQTD